MEVGIRIWKKRREGAELEGPWERGLPKDSEDCC